jgi:hypothetical protein
LRQRRPLDRKKVEGWARAATRSNEVDDMRRDDCCEAGWGESVGALLDDVFTILILQEAFGLVGGFGEGWLVSRVAGVNDDLGNPARPSRANRDRWKIPSSTCRRDLYASALFYVSFPCICVCIYTPSYSCHIGAEQRLFRPSLGSREGSSLLP